MAAPGSVAASPWAPRCRRAEELRDRHPHAEEVLTLYLALLGVWEEAWNLPSPPADAGAMAGWAAQRVLPRVVEVTAKVGPEPLAEGAAKLLAEGAAEAPLVAWLAGDELEPVERYLARTCLRVPLELPGTDAGAVCARDPSPRGGRRCPRCGGPPQLSFRDHSEDGLVSGHRRLACARCAASWSYTGSACAACGETTSARRTVYGERRDGPVVGRGNGRERGGGGEDDGAPVFPHLRIEGCESCKHYLIDVDLGREARAVPEVDELAALPLDLYASERGLSKVTPNLMGF